MEFHVSRQSRDRYHFDDALFSLSGNVIFANFQAARTFAQKINQTRDLLHHPEQAVPAAEINAMGLIDEILHVVVDLYREQNNPRVLGEALVWLKGRIGAPAVEQALVAFAMEFPPLAVYRGELSLAEYYESVTDGLPNEQVLLDEMLMLWLANKNPAFGPYQELFDDAHLSAETVYAPIFAELHRFFEMQPGFGPDNQNLIDVLRAPATKFPHSLFAQLEYIREQWLEQLLGSRFRELFRRLLISIDFIREEETQRGFTGPGPVEVPIYDDVSMPGAEVENFSQDREWMPRLVLIAKNTYVWLDQLSQTYGKKISHLDEIPDAELEKLARWGFSGLWLIGLWERSRASARIKQLMGNPEALASAYSLYDYRIASELGGEEAYQRLRENAWRYGIRLASDMVPNHMGIDSPWVVEHPDWFLSLDYSPFPSYTFHSTDLSEDERAGIFLEDHYYTRSDAAVVFQEVDRGSGHTRYIYHGNDGTSMPWNDTAQLNYLLPQVREAVIQTILAVARRFPIIRFDAAMTLAKLHYQRLWFPTPGTGGAIPSRAEFGMSKEQFDQLMPVEFWREVVDRVAQEAPDTLLLAEAFWMMEGYFVRTLGMHRVYNSAFMNLLRDEENAKYRLIMKNTLEFDPEILKRYVNFMNNPDERTAVDQFGKDDKYFGICMLMATLPGLPMFGHGQVEGFSEKYGMEFKRAYWSEQPDGYLVARHEREIFPVLHRRALFAGVDQFLLYDFFSPDGSVNENVYAYSNGMGNERSLVVYNNGYTAAQGWVRTSVGFSVKGGDGERTIIQRSLGDALHLGSDPRAFSMYRDQVSGLEYIRPSREIVEQGLYFALQGYEYHVFLDFQEVMDVDGTYQRVYDYLGGRGTPAVHGALQELLLQPVFQPLRQIFHVGYLRYMLDARLTPDHLAIAPGFLEEASEKYTRLLDGIQQISGGTGSLVAGREALQRSLRAGLRLALGLGVIEHVYPLPGSQKYQQAFTYLRDAPPAQLDENGALLWMWLYLRDVGKLGASADYGTTAAAWFDEWGISTLVSETTVGLGVDAQHAQEIPALMKILLRQQGWFDLYTLAKYSTRAILTHWFSDPEVQQYLDIHRFEDVLWFQQERFETFVWWMALLALFDTTTHTQTSAALLVERLLMVYSLVQQLLTAEQASEFQVDRLLAECEPEESTE